jgi:hypothetical protein
MNQLNKLSFAIILLAVTLSFTGCSDKFLENMQDYNAYGGTEVYNDLTGATERVNYLYYLMQPSSTSGLTYCMTSAGVNDICSGSTEEHGGLIYTDATNPGNWVNPSIVLNSTNVPDYFYYQNKNISPYGYIRECNNVIEGIQGGTLSAANKAPLLGQAYFFRAWMYLHLVKIYGGVPIIDHVQNPMIGTTGGENLIVPRSTTLACINFICNDLETAAKYLPLSWGSSSDGRVTAGAALAVAGRARLLYASPVYNRADVAARWELAYQINKSARDTLLLGGFGLAYANNPGTNGSNWAKMFSDYNSPEAVFVTLYNNLLPVGNGTTYFKNNQWENGIRPINTGGGGGKSTTSQMIDLFPMADGRPSSQYLTSSTSTVSANLTASSYTYDPLRFFANRDPRFYRTFAFPGERWAFSGDTVTLGLTFPYRGTNYKLWSYTWYDNASNQTADNVTGFAADGLGTNNTSVYVRKRSDDYDVNNTPLYAYSSILGANKNFLASAAPYMEIRYAEVLLNFAEAACGANHPAEAIAALISIRQRAGIPQGSGINGYGLDDDLVSNRAKLFAAILYERQVELAFEGKRFDDMYRWMLWDGGSGQSSLKASWALTGFDGNTCTYLGVNPLNGMRRTGMEVTVSPNNSIIGSGYISTMTTAAKFANDPIIKAGIKRSPVGGLNLMDTSNSLIWSNPSKPSTPMDSLCWFYNNYFQRKTTRVDGDLTYFITFQPQYYFIGLKNSAQQMNVTLKQTIGWADLENGGANGTYDPLAE